MKFFNAFLIFGWVSCADRVGPVTPQTPVERQMLGLLEKFDRWDDNGDGELDAEEINEGIQSLKGKPQQVSYQVLRHRSQWHHLSKGGARWISPRE